MSATSATLATLVLAAAWACLAIARGLDVLLGRIKR